MTELPRVDFEELDLGEDQMIVWKQRPFTGIAVDFFPNGAPWSEVPHLDGLRHGLAREWYPSGQLKDEINYWQGGLHGYHREWNEQGRLVAEDLGEFGIGISEKRWDEQGRLIKEWHIGPKDSWYEDLQFRRKHYGQLAPPLPKT